MTHVKKLTKASPENTMIAGVIGGFAEYYNINPTLLRLAFVFGVLISGLFPLTVLYLAAIVIMPEAPKTNNAG